MCMRECKPTASECSVGVSFVCVHVCWSHLTRAVIELALIEARELIYHNRLCTTAHDGADDGGGWQHCATLHSLSQKGTHSFFQSSCAEFHACAPAPSIFNFQCAICTGPAICEHTDTHTLQPSLQRRARACVRICVR